MKNKRKKKAMIKYTVFGVFAVFVAVFAAFTVHEIFGGESSNTATGEPDIQVSIAPLPTYGTASPSVPSDSPGKAADSSEAPSPSSPSAVPAHAKKVIVLDPGHGKSSSLMSESEKTQYGWVKNQGGQWGEWRHWKTGTTWHDCEGSGCSKRAPSNGSCWYPIGSSDRSKEPEINLNNVLAAKKYLEEYGYEVRLTRSTNDENPSMTQRLKYCYPALDTSSAPDADAFICIHSNAGGGRGSSYITLSGTYDQAGIAPTYIEDGNRLGKLINDSIVSSTSLGAYGGGAYNGYPELILFCKSPVTIAYLEIGFFDNSSDLSILNSEYDSIGKAIADGINAYFN